MSYEYPEYLPPSLDDLQRYMIKNWGVGLDETGLKYLQNNYNLYNKLYNGWMSTNPNSLSEDFAEYMGRKSKVLYPHIVDANSIKNTGALGKPASSIMKGGVRGAAHLIPIVGAGLTAADIYQGLNQPVGAADIPYQQQLQTVSPFEKNRMMNLHYFGR